jgi:2-dehydropantoate 2-reductase
MRILIVGAGAIGGYFGGRLAEAGKDVTFLVRPKRAAELAESGLVIRSRLGDVQIARPATVLARDLREPFDLVILSTKAYDLEDAIASFAPAVGPSTSILPLLNGMRHLDILEQRFGRERVLGGQCFIGVTLNQKREIVQLNDFHELSFGELDGKRSPRVEAVAAAMAKVRFQARLSSTIVQEMWEKWVFIASAAITCLMRASVGDIQAAGGAALATELIEECGTIAAAEGHAPRAEAMERNRATLTAAGSPLTSSMFRDMEQRQPVEADHIVGDLLRRGEKHGIATPVLRVLHLHLKAYEARREREAQTVREPRNGQDKKLVQNAVR